MNVSAAMLRYVSVHGPRASHGVWPNSILLHTWRSCIPVPQSKCFTVVECPTQGNNKRLARKQTALSSGGIHRSSLGTLLCYTDPGCGVNLISIPFSHFNNQVGELQLNVKCEGPMGLAMPNLAERHTQQQKASEQKHGSDKSVSSFAGDVFFNLREIEKSFERNGEKERDPGHFSSTMLLLSFCCGSVRARAHREQNIVFDGCSSILVVLTIVGIGFCPLLQFMVCDVADKGTTRWPFHCFVFHKGRRIGSPPSCHVHCTCKGSFHKNTPNVAAPAWLDETEPIHSILSTVHYDS
mgnify:CR=1 FL=1